MTILHEEMGKSNTDYDEMVLENILLEEALESMGALSAAAIIRRNYPRDSAVVKRYDQHHDNDIDILDRWRKCMLRKNG